MRLDSLCSLRSTQVDPRDFGDTVYIGLEHIEPGRLVASAHGTAKEVGSAKGAFQPGDVLYGKLRPYLDKAVVVTQTGVCSTELLVLRPNEDVDPHFLLSAIHSPSFVEHAIAGTTGAQHPRTSWSHVGGFELPPFTAAEQASIARLVAKADAALSATIQAASSLEETRLAAMRELFTRGLRGEPRKETEIGPVPASWHVVPFATAREWLQYGTSKHCSVQPKAYSVLRIPNVGPGFVDPSDLKYCDMTMGEADKYRLRDGDLLFIRTNGVLDRLGSCAVYAGHPANALFASYLIRARLKPDISPRYVAYFYGSERGTSLVAGRATPAADGKYNLNTGTIDSLPLALPPTMDEQRDIVAILDAIDHKIDLHRRKRQILEELFKALLHKLMTGEIRVQDLDLSALDRPVAA